MIRFCVLSLMTLMTAAAQDASVPIHFQPAAQVLPAAGGRGGMVMPLPRQEAGKPFSATVTNTTTQTLADGTHLNRTSTMVEYRDSEGRVRVESEDRVTVRDPVSHAAFRLDPSRKTATNLVAAPVAAPVGGMRGGRGNMTPEATAPPPDASVLAGQSARALDEVEARRLELLAQRGTANPNETTVDLGTAIVNGVSARGTRVTTVVPVNSIGNDRELRSVTERWFSTDLNLLIKSVSSDPRFGTTTYELTNIKQANPDISLFQIPSDFALVSNGGRGR